MWVLLVSIRGVVCLFAVITATRLEVYIWIFFLPFPAWYIQKHFFSIRFYFSSNKQLTLFVYTRRLKISLPIDIDILSSSWKRFLCQSRPRPNMVPWLIANIPYSRLRASFVINYLLHHFYCFRYVPRQEKERNKSNPSGICSARPIFSASPFFSQNKHTHLDKKGEEVYYNQVAHLNPSYTS